MRSHSVLVSFLIAVLGLSSPARHKPIPTARAPSVGVHGADALCRMINRSLSPAVSEFNVNSDIGWGFRFGYNFNDHLAMSFDIGWNSPSYDATIVSADTPALASRRASGEMSTSSMHLNLHYNLIAGPITPFVTAGIGTTYVDSNLAYGPPSSSCWYDRTGAITCDSYQPTYSDSRFSYNASVGMRWEPGTRCIPARIHRHALDRYEKQR